MSGGWFVVQLCIFSAIKGCQRENTSGGKFYFVMEHFTIKQIKTCLFVIKILKDTNLGCTAIFPISFYGKNSFYSKIKILIFELSHHFSIT